MPSLTSTAWSLAATAAAPALRLLLQRRAASGKELPARLPERTGANATPRPAGRLLWLHAASVGETVSALPLVAALPDSVHVLFTTGTVTSAALLHDRLLQAGLAHRVLHSFVPLDVPAWARAFLDHWRPDAACFLESELWPNLLAACRARGVPAALVNARLSPRSAAGWARAPRFAREVLRSFDWVAAQSDGDAARLAALGARRVDAPGNLKFAAPRLPADAAELARLQGVLGGRPRWLAASTHPGDDSAVAAAHRTLAARHPGLLTAVVPRHPQRGPALAAMLAAPRRSLRQGPPEGGVWVADTLGELGLMYRCFPTVFVGKSFAAGKQGGGQNPWEPAQLGCAVACGPHMENFGEAVDRLSRAGALSRLDDEAGLAAWVGTMLTDPAAAQRARQAAQAATALSSDLPGLLAGRLVELMDARSPHRPVELHKGRLRKSINGDAG